jgi:hypothetical protein
LLLNFGLRTVFMRTVQLDLTSVDGPKDGWYLNSLIQEIDIATGAVLFNWSSIDHIALSESYNNITATGEGGSSSLAWDAVHINSIDKVRISYLSLDCPD